MTNLINIFHSEYQILKTFLSFGGSYDFPLCTCNVYDACFILSLKCNAEFLERSIPDSCLNF